MKLNSKPLCVFDIDSTLVCVKKRTEKILQEASFLIKEKAPQKGRLLEGLRIQPQDFNIKEILKRVGLLPGDSLYKEVFHFWTRHFFSDRYLKEDFLYKGVRGYLSALKEQGCEIMYLTGRYRPAMGEGTLLQLKNFNLPLKTKEHLMMKPNNYMEDAYFKKDHLSELSKKYDPIWFFENEPVVINFVYSFLKSVRIIFVNTAHSGRQSLNGAFPMITADYSD